MSHPKHILVIRLSAFGDIIRCMGTLAAIRAAHRDAHITFLTIPAFARLLDGSGYADDVWALPRFHWWQLGKAFAFTRGLIQRQIDAVYDLQRNDRTRMLKALAPRALQQRWYAWEKPKDAGILDTSDVSVFPMPDSTWMAGDVARFAIPSPYALLVPGSAPQHPKKRWPAASYAALARRMVQAGITPVAIGGDAEHDVTATIQRDVPSLVDLTAQTSLGDIASLARGAVATVGNDTGPMHVVALVGCPIVSLFSGQTDPAVCAPMGNTVTVLREQDIADISVDAVWQVFTGCKR